MIVPGSVNPLLLVQGGDPLDELGKIERSVRLRRSAGANLSRTFPAPGSLTTWTFRVCCKRADLANYLRIFGIGNDSNSVSQHSMTFYGGSGEVQFILTNAGAAAVAAVETNAAKRDPAAHCDLQFTWDTTNPTASERLRVYCDGVRQTVKSTTYPAQNTAGLINTAALHRIGALSASTSFWFDGYLSHVAFIDGQALEPSAFGQTHPRTGQWRPKSKAAIRAAVAAGGGARNGWGANGFFLPFDDTTSLTTLGYDRSQSDTDTTGNNWTATNISLAAGTTYDSMLDTPTNNFPTLNTLQKAAAHTLSNGNLDLVHTGTLTYPIGATQAVSGGKWYLEVTQGAGGSGSPLIGLMRAAAINPAANTAPGYDSNGWSIAQNGNKVHNNVATSITAAFANADVYRIAVDLDAGKVWFGKNAAWLEGDPAAGTSPSYSNVSGEVTPAGGGAGATTYWNFGQRPFAYSPPAGFKAICTKNLPIKPAGPMKSSSAFVALSDTGANIQTAIASASPWNDWIRIYKSLAAEGWRWQFSDDQANCLESNNTNAKIAFPPLAGASYQAYALKLSPTNGIASGRLVHTSGAADVVVDGLSNARKMVMLRNEAGGNWFVYHPDLTAGKLLYLNLQNAETTDASISAVTSSGFTVAAALASGTYRWISFAEVEGFLKLWKYIANGSADGPFHNDGLAPVASWWRDADTGTNNWHTHDTARDPYNQSNRNLIFNLSDAESSQHGMDLNSNGAKLRNSSSGSNLSGAKHIGVSFGQPFRYANAR